MPIQTRCPSCTAAVPSNAAWCSLCHADLRPRRDPVRLAATVVPGGSSPSASASFASPSSMTSSASLTHAPDTSGAEEAQATMLLDDPRPTGRHSSDPAFSRPEVEAAALAPALPAAPAQVRSAVPRGRHAAGRASAPSAAPVEGIELPADGQATPEEVEALAAQMLSRLAIHDPRPHVFDPAEMPGGKWGFAAACTLGIVVVLAVFGALIGLVANR